MAHAVAGHTPVDSYTGREGKERGSPVQRLWVEHAATDRQYGAPTVDPEWSSDDRFEPAESEIVDRLRVLGVEPTTDQEGHSPEEIRFLVMQAHARGTLGLQFMNCWVINGEASLLARLDLDPWQPPPCKTG